MLGHKAQTGTNKQKAHFCHITGPTEPRKVKSNSTEKKDTTAFHCQC
jgi:hypothetical protein